VVPDRETEGGRSSGGPVRFGREEAVQRLGVDVVVQRESGVGDVDTGDVGDGVGERRRQFRGAVEVVPDEVVLGITCLLLGALCSTCCPFRYID